MRQYQAKQDSTHSMGSNIRILLAMLAAAVVLFCGLNYFFAPIGYFAVQSACDREGGLRINETDQVDGYWHATEEGIAGCAACAGQVARGDFHYVEFGPASESEEDRATTDAQYFRFELRPKDGQDCYHDEGFETPPAGTCVVKTKISGKPTSKYLLRSDVVYLPVRFGDVLRQYRRSIYDRETHKLAATFHHFEYGTPAERAGNFAWRYSCVSPSINPLSEFAFVRKVLADRSATTSREKRS